MLYKYVKSQPIRPVSTYKSNPYPVKKSKTILSISILTLFAGIVSLGYSVYPYASAAFYSSGAAAVEKTVLTSNNSDSDVLGVATNGSLSSTYVSNLYKNLSTTNKQLDLNDSKLFPELASKTGQMTVTIDRLGLKDTPIKINVNSLNEKDYLPVLESELAHFKGSSLPNFPGNTFIYGHSTNELLARYNPHQPKIAFTFLNNLEIGDSIKIQLDGQTYSYSVQKSKIVEPDDVSPILSKSEKKTLTLMTCWPPGVGEKRLIIIANQES